ncbi:hypothetical protein [Rhodococcus sp. JG-3]|uniref:hypothetical protein n=1 Tax=Rhodococcus sp. JG-3 TaxID=1305835 RepID=UPI00068561F3|nr:hypothetical protein [Rhodococcus sp. JG-3]
MLIGSLATIIVGGIITGGVLLLNRDSEPETFTVAGSMSLTKGSGWDSISTGCVGDGGYDDIRSGAAIKISDESGTVLATGRLEGGQIDSGMCTFPFMVDGVPAGEAFYEIEVSHRGGLTYDEAEMREPLVFTLG